jgi:hypothetical protein
MRVSAVAETATVRGALGAGERLDSRTDPATADDTLKPLGIGCLALSAAIIPLTTLSGQSLEGGPVTCKGQRVTRIEVYARPPFEVRGSKVQQRLARQLAEFHRTTNPNIIRRFLALREGQPCTEIRRTESERILRGQPYLADASVIAFPDEDGGVSIAVYTVDEVSLLAGGGAKSKSPYVRALRLGEENLMGEAVTLVGSWLHSPDFRDTWSARMIDYQLLGRPFQLRLEATRNEIGGEWAAEASHPFLTDLQRYSWRTTAGNRDGYRFFRQPNGQTIALPLRRAYADIGAVTRIGPPRRIALVGMSMSYERELPGIEPFMLRPGMLERDTTGRPMQTYESHRNTRLNALLGVRLVDFLQVTGFESLDGVQDVRKGLELSTLFGRGIGAWRAREQDRFVSGDIYLGFGSPLAFGAVDVVAEGRRPPGLRGWDGVLASGRAALYVKPITRHTLLASAEWSAGWRQRFPFQVSLYDKDGGPKGYAKSWAGGGRRVVTRVEDRIHLGRLKQFASVGVAPFVNSGQVWAGDAPFGVDSKLVWSAGVSLIAAVPPRSQRTFRLDLAYPFDRSTGAKPMFRFSARSFTRIFWKEPGDVALNRERAVPISIFNWP